MERTTAVELLGRLHAAQQAMYGGGSAEPLRDLLTADIEWHVPGDNAIAGTYRGVDAVIAYFERRRDLAGGTFRMHPGDVLVGEGNKVAVLTDGTAILSGHEHGWSTVGLYEFRAERLARCWLLPLDPTAFDRVWRADAAAG